VAHVWLRVACSRCTILCMRMSVARDVTLEVVGDGGFVSFAGAFPHFILSPAHRREGVQNTAPLRELCEKTPAHRTQTTSLRLSSPWFCSAFRALPHA
jgi:hypothetical protein